MEIFKIEEYLKEEVKKVLDKLFPEAGEGLAIEAPPQKKFGDYSTPVALSIAKRTKDNPEAIAEKIVAKLGKLDFVEKVEVVKPGYVNFFLDFQKLSELLFEKFTKNDKLFIERKKLSNPPKVVIEHTSVNPNKAMHVGHLRNSILGDSLARIYRFAGFNVEVQNYIDDTGLQVAYLVLGLLAIKNNWYKDYPKKNNYSKKDYYYWDVYSWIFSKLEAQKELKEPIGSEQQDLQGELKKILDSLENQTGEYAALGEEIATLMVNAHLETNARLDIFYDLLIWESSILEKKLWETASALLKKNKKFILKKTGKNKDCWVLDYGDERRDKVFVRSDGTALYVAKDFAYHLWKFGLVSDPFSYFIWCTQKNQKKLFSTQGSEKYQDKTAFARADQIINVIDETQSYTQNAVIDALGYLGFVEQAKNYKHLAYGRVLLSENTMKAMRIKIQEKRKAYPMSGRKGVGVKVDDLLDTLTKEILNVRKSQSEFKIDNETARKIAIASIRYFMVKMSYDQELIFDSSQALQTEGNTGVYLVYSLVRATNILKKSIKITKVVKDSKDNFNEYEKALLKDLSQFQNALDDTLSSADPSILAEYAYSLACDFSSFYNNVPVLKAQENEKDQRLFLVKVFARIMSTSLDLLGIPTLEKM